MDEKEDGGEEAYFVVVSEEGQYSLWPSTRALPLGWSPIGPAQAKEGCLETIKAIWAREA